MRAAITVVNLVFLAGSVLLLLFTILSGSSNHSPLNEFYWLKADTSGIPGAPTTAAWTFWGVCEFDDYSKCTLGPAYPISPVNNFDTTEGVPQDFIDNKNLYYYLTRFSFAFTLVAIGFTAISFIIDILAFCFVVIDKVAVIFIVIALFFTAGTAAFQTAAIVLAKQAFNDADLNAKIGVKSMALIWTAVVTLLISFLLTCAFNIGNSYKKHMDRVYAKKQANEDSTYNPDQPAPLVGPDGDESSFVRSAPVEEQKESSGGGIRFFRIERKVPDEESV